MERELDQVRQRSKKKGLGVCVHGSGSLLKGACLHVVFVTLKRCPVASTVVGKNVVLSDFRQRTNRDSCLAIAMQCHSIVYASCKRKELAGRICFS